MSTEIQSSTQNTTSTTPTDEEKEMQRLQLEQYKTTQPAQTQLQQNALALGNQLLTSFGNQNGDMWKTLIGGVTDEQTQQMINEQQRYLNPQYQSQGLYDSGTAYTASLRAATDLANQNAQYNVGVLQNALNLALSGQAQVQSPVQSSTNTLANQLSGLRTVSSTGTTTNSSNPFLSSFYSNYGSGLASNFLGR